MQYHLNGFVPGNLQQPESIRNKKFPPKLGGIPSEVDVLIVGCGPAGLSLARQLAVFPEIKTCIIDAKSGPMLFGQADGVSCRTIEIMEAYNSSELILKESYWLNQIAFWDTDKKSPQNIKCTQKIPDPRIGLSEFPHVVLNQARIHDLLLEGMANSASQLHPKYSCQLIDLKIDNDKSDDMNSFPVLATIQCICENNKETNKNLKARYIVGCDGARSTVREKLGIPLEGDSSNKSWGVIDALVVTDFPDIRVKSFIKSENEGSILIIPREGGYLVRFYIELEQLEKNERISQKNIKLEELIDSAKKIFHPYNFDVKEVPWWSVYEIGQRISESFDNLPVKREKGAHPRAFIAGDACHTHSPKAGQGMNVSIHDAFNLGWKLSSVILGNCHPNLLNTYNYERRAIAQDLINLDKDFSDLVSGKSESGAISVTEKDKTNSIKEYFAKQTGFIAGTSIEYKSSVITSEGKYQDLAHGFIIGQRFHSAKVIRLSDGRELHLGHINKADGRWRLFVFGDLNNPVTKSSEMFKLIKFLSSSKNSPVTKYTDENSDIDSKIDVNFIFQNQNILIEQLPEFLWPPKGKYSLRDYEKVFVSIPDRNIFELRKINRQCGCIVIVRPDQHIANIIPITAHNEISNFFSNFMICT